MRFPIKVEYACRAVLELALHWPNNQPLNINAIAQRQKIPLKFLTQILLDLKKIGIAESARGQQGGYLLTTSPQEICLNTILKYYVPLQSRQTKKQLSNIFGQIWVEMNQTLEDYLKKITFEDLKKKELNSRAVVSYAI